MNFISAATKSFNPCDLFMTCFFVLFFFCFRADIGPSVPANIMGIAELLEKERRLVEEKQKEQQMMMQENEKMENGKDEKSEKVSNSV